jgi:hypothetical protein
MRSRNFGIPAAILVSAFLAHGRPLGAAEKQPETVLVTYHVVAGKMDDLLEQVRRQWHDCRRLGLMLESPHVILSGLEEGGKPYLVEVLRWRDADAPDSIPDRYPQVAAIWKRMRECVEKRGGHPGIDIEQMELLGVEPTGVAPAQK